MIDPNSLGGIVFIVAWIVSEGLLWGAMRFFISELEAEDESIFVSYFRRYRKGASIGGTAGIAIAIVGGIGGAIVSHTFQPQWGISMFDWTLATPPNHFKDGMSWWAIPYLTLSYEGLGVFLGAHLGALLEYISVSAIAFVRRI